VIGIRESAGINDIIVAVRLAVIFLFLVFAAPRFSIANWVTPENPDGLFIPPNAGTGIYGWSGVVRGAAAVFFAYRVRCGLRHRPGSQAAWPRPADRYPSARS